MNEITKISFKDKLNVFLRSFLLQAGWNYLRFQGIGFGFVMTGFLRKIYNRAELKKIMPRYLSVFNTNPFTASFAFGALAKIELEEIKNGGPGQEEWNTAKAFLMSSLASLGDRFFWALLRPFAFTAALLWLFLCCPGILGPGAGAALPLWAYAGALAVYLVLFNAPALIIRWYGLGRGLKGVQENCYGLLSLDWNKLIKIVRCAGLAAATLLAGAAAFGLFYVPVYDAEFVLLASACGFFIIFSLSADKANVPNVYVYLASVAVFLIISFFI
jgi:mannose/fructose/N-acetylgalactosamine-specific phosphotransferase system component IID